MPGDKPFGQGVRVFAEEVGAEEEDVFAHGFYQEVKNTWVGRQFPDEFFIKMPGLQTNLAFFFAFPGFQFVEGFAVGVDLCFGEDV